MLLFVAAWIGIGWLPGVGVFNGGGFAIHVLLLFALISGLLHLANRGRRFS
jgi:hypothetical protein